MRCQYWKCHFSYLEMFKYNTRKVIKRIRIIPFHLKPNVDIKRDHGYKIYFNGSNSKNLMLAESNKSRSLEPYKYHIEN